MNNDLTTTTKAVAKPWKWRDTHATFHSPARMGTQHLFFTLRMIWNHRMPAAARIPGCPVHTFHPHYTDEYFKEAILHLSVELVKRTDMTPTWQKQLDHMVNWLKTNQIPLTSKEQIK